MPTLFFMGALSACLFAEHAGGWFASSAAAVTLCRQPALRNDVDLVSTPICRCLCGFCCGRVLRREEHLLVSTPAAVVHCIG